MNVPAAVFDNDARPHRGNLKEICGNQMGNAYAPVRGRMPGQIPFMNAYRPVHPHEVGHFGRLKPFSRPRGFLSDVAVPLASVTRYKGPVIGMMVPVLGGDAEIAVRRHAVAFSGADGSIGYAVRATVNVHHLLFLVHHDQKLSGQGRIILPLEQMAGDGSLPLKIPGQFLHRCGGSRRKRGIPPASTAGSYQNRDTEQQGRQGKTGQFHYLVRQHHSVRQRNAGKKNRFLTKLSTINQKNGSFPSLHHILALLRRGRSSPGPWSSPWDQASAKVRAASAV